MKIPQGLVLSGLERILMTMKPKHHKSLSLMESLLSEDDIESFEESTVFFEDGDATDAAVNPTPEQPLELQNISLDKKVDHFMIQYERESLPTSAKYQEPNLSPPEVATPAYPTEGRALARLAMVLLEQDDTDAGGGADAGGGGAAGGDTGEGGGGTDPNKKPDVRPPTMNVQNFARSMARLINNYEALCDPKSTMINRAKAYLLKNYDPNLAKEFMIIMESQYDLTPRDMGDPETTKGPPAAGAWSGGGGGGGGGG